MLIDVLKFIHLLLTLCLLAATFICLILTGFHPEKKKPVMQLSRLMPWLLGCAILTGTLLVYPKHFTFHTQWIDAAYLLALIAGLLLSLSLVFKKRIIPPKIQCVIYIMVLLILIVIVHDAVTKTTFLF